MLDIANDIRSLSDFKRNTSELLDRLKKTGNPLVLTINGKAEVVVQDEIEGGRLLREERAAGPVLDFGFKAAAAECADDSAVGEEEGFGAFLLRAGTFDAGDDAEGEGLTLGQRGRQCIKKARHRRIYIIVRRPRPVRLRVQGN